MRQVDKLGREALVQAAKTSMSSKILNVDSGHTLHPVINQRWP